MNADDTKQSMRESSRSAWQLMSQSAHITWERLDLIGWFSLMYVAGTALMIGSTFGGALLFHTAMPMPVVILLGLLGVTAAMVLMVANTGAILYTITEPATVKYWQGWKLAWPNLLRLIWIGVLSSLLVMVGSLLFIIPGLVLMIYLLFSQFVLAAEGKTGLDAMTRSWQLVYGRFWGTVGRFGLAVLIVLLVSIVSTVITESMSGSGIGEMVGVLVSILLQSFTSIFILFVVRGWYLERDEVVDEDEPLSMKVRNWLKAGIWAGVVLTVVVPPLAGTLAMTVFKEDIMRWYINEQLKEQMESGFEMPTGMMQY